VIPLEIVMNAILLTLCGCSKLTTVDLDAAGKVPPTFKCPASDGGADRTFKLVVAAGMADKFAIYRERR
jgi:hypothetical protein